MQTNQKLCGKNGRIEDFALLTKEPRTFSLLEFEFSVTDLPQEINVYREEELDIVFTMVSESGKIVKIPAFYYEEFRFTTSAYLIGRTDKPGCFRVRVSPPEAGVWQYTVTLSIYGEEKDSLSGTVTVAKSEQGSKVLQVEPNRRQVFETADGEPVFFIGRNLAWNATPHTPGTFSQYTVDNIRLLSQNGGNIFRIWDVNFCVNCNRKAVHEMHQHAGAMWDKVFEAADQNHVYISYVMFPHGELSTTCDADFCRGIFSKERGGYLDNAADFFSDEPSIAAVKTYIRYIISRFGYSEYIVWEMFNEIDHVDAMNQGRVDEVRVWLDNTAAYIRGLDPYHHLVSNSVHTCFHPILADSIDFIYHHRYNQYALSSVSDLCRRSWEDYNRPVVMGEFGWAGAEVTSVLGGYFASDFLGMHQGDWACMMGGGASNGWCWWWDSMPKYGDPYAMFRSLSAMAKRIPWADPNMKAITSETLQAGENTRIETLGYISETYAYLWFYDNRFSALKRDEMVFENATLPLSLKDGVYQVEWINSFSGEAIQTTTETAKGGKLLLAMPTWSQEIALVVTEK